jgi:hypothetical protein
MSPLRDATVSAGDMSVMPATPVSTVVMRAIVLSATLMR